eukprot:4222661-Amphidinium_carterae.1
MEEREQKVLQAKQSLKDSPSLSGEAESSKPAVNPNSSAPGLRWSHASAGCKFGWFAPPQQLQDRAAGLETLRSKATEVQREASRLEASVKQLEDLPCSCQCSI